MLTEDALGRYGNTLWGYRGDGLLTLASSREVPCDFVCGQFETGKTLLLCATNAFVPSVMLGAVEPTRFEGTTTEGFRLQTHRALTGTSYLPEAQSQVTYLALRCGHLEIAHSRRRSRRKLWFLLANLHGADRQVTFMLDGIRLLLRPSEASCSNLERLQFTRGVLPTAEIEATTRASVEKAVEAVDKVCYLLSVALGTKVQWIAMAETTAAGSWVSRHHYSRPTKRYGTLRLVEKQTPGIDVFLQRMFSGGEFRGPERFRVTEAAIDSYLDAKSEGDFLQVRALKLVVSVEMMKADFSDALGGNAPAMPWELFKSRRNSLKEAIKSVFPDVAPDQRKALYSKLRELNRGSFASALSNLCAELRAPLTRDEIARFVDSRNKLVHKGRFYCERATLEERARRAPLPDVVSEWFWLLHFVDRLFLRAIGYEGQYVDWSQPGTPTVRNLRASA